MIIKPQEEFNSFFMIKRGEINCFDKDYNYLQTLEPESFFGEYNIVFQLYSSAYYQIAPRTEGSIIFKIDKDKLMGIICKDSGAFKHLFGLCLQKLRYQNKIEQEVMVIDSREKEKFKKIHSA